RTLMIGVSMGMTSEEPITHLTWFDELLQERRIPDPGSHIEVMTLPGSYLDEFARQRGSRMVPIQLDGENHTPGRMSAPATRVFLRPVALMLAAAGVAGGLQTILQRGQALYGLSHTLSDEARRQLTLHDPFLRLAAWLSLRADRAAGAAGATAGEAGPTAGGAPKLLVTISPGWEGFLPWLEQLVEESLGKDGKGFLVFYGQSAAAYGEDCAALRIAVEGYDAPPALVPPHGARPWPSLTLHVPAPPQPLSRLPSELAGLGELTGLFLGMKKTVAAYGYLQDIVFAGQPAVEAYKRYARELREAPAPPSSPGRVQGPQGIVMDYSSLLRRGLLDESSLQALARRQGGQVTSPADVLGAILAAAREAGTLRYLDFTWNGELDEGLRALFERHRQRLANQTLRIPAKIRTGPSDYHSTEQSETDGPPELVSLRLVAERHEPVEAGRYDDTFLLAQARGTWQAMEDAGRWIVFLTVPAADEPAIEALDRLLEATAERLA
ncbi:MAG TPA: hypothetical protein VHN78_11890, partial [Chloroflexota bacterium]|nr:hypothetical protein [Chloroflexota bacterium]